VTLTVEIFLPIGDPNHFNHTSRVTEN